MIQQKSKRKTRIGRVVSDKMQKTIIVRVMRLTKHPRYKKIMKKYNKFKVHDEHNKAKLGDLVKIEETRPLSKEKRWRLVEILK
jgi:small subunit ribosomal protein S17